MDEKISALPFSATILGNDDIPFASAGTTYRTWRSVLFISTASEQMTFSSGGALVGIDNAGNAIAQVGSGNQISWWVGGFNIAGIDAAGNFNMAPPSGSSYFTGYIQADTITVMGAMTCDTLLVTVASTAPPTQNVAPPATAFGAGTIVSYLGTPDAWVDIVVAGTAYKIPLYLP